MQLLTLSTASGFRNYSCGPDGPEGDGLFAVAQFTPAPGSPFFLSAEGFYNQVGISSYIFICFLLLGAKTNLLSAQKMNPEHYLKKK
jgi:hypothetical protein